MSPIAIASIVFVCVFGGALFGMFLNTSLPAHHLSDPSKDVVKVVTGLIATLAALVLGLLVSSAKTSFDTANEGFRQSAAKLIILDRALAQYGPETRGLREALRKNFQERIGQYFAKDRSGNSALSSTAATVGMEEFAQKLRALTPQNDAQRAYQSRAIDMLEVVAEARWLGVENEGNTIPTAFLVVLVFWLAAMFVSFGLFAPRNKLVVTVLFMGALSISGAIFLIEELFDPLGGVITISSAPLYKAIGLLGQ